MTKIPFYHGIIRKTIVAFGSMFSNIHIDRRQGDSVNGPVIQTLHVPIAYAPKEKWLVRLDSDPELNSHTYTSLPRISFEVTGYSMDTTRQLARANKITCSNADGSSEMGVPVPWNLDIQLYILTKTQEDAMQIVEQILPWFRPERVVSINAIPGMNIVNDIPFTLNSVSVSDEYDGDFATRRFVTHTLSFTAKMNMFGPTSQNQPIYSSGAALDTGSGTRKFVTTGDPDTYTIIDCMWSDE